MSRRVVVPDRLWIGDASDLRAGTRTTTGFFNEISSAPLHKNLLNAGIRTVVDLAYEEEPARLPRSATYCRFPLIDGEGNDRSLLLLAIETVASLIRADIPTLVTCSMGRSRSPTIVAAAIAVVHNIPPRKSLPHVAESGPLDVSPGLWGDVESLLREQNR